MTGRLTNSALTAILVLISFFTASPIVCVQARLIHQAIEEATPTYDITLAVRNAAGTTMLLNAEVVLNGPARFTGHAFDGTVSFKGLPSGMYTIHVKWASPITGGAFVHVGTFVKDISALKQEPDLLCNVYDIAIRVSDSKGRAVSEASIVISNAEATTDASGTAVFALIPKGTYLLRVEKTGADLGASPSSIDVWAGNLDFAIIAANIFDLGVWVFGGQSQGLPYSMIYIKDPRTGAALTYTTDPNGVITIPGLLLGTYEVAAEYKGFRSDWASVNVTAPGIVRVFKLPVYTEVFGEALTFWTWLAIVAMVLLFVFGTAVIIVYSLRWRKRKSIQNAQRASRNVVTTIVSLMA